MNEVKPKQTPSVFFCLRWPLLMKANLQFLWVFAQIKFPHNCETIKCASFNSENVPIVAFSVRCAAVNSLAQLVITEWLDDWEVKRLKTSNSNQAESIKIALFSDFASIVPDLQLLLLFRRARVVLYAISHLRDSFVSSSQFAITTKNVLTN